jgi:coenzyme F420 hydrogenase subunit beta
MKAVETVLHLRREYPNRIKNMVPEHVWALVEPYGLKKKEEESTSFLKKRSKKLLSVGGAP